MNNIYILIGTRPNFIKVTRFKSLAKKKGKKITLIHTGQHYDDDMANVFFEQFNLRPDYFLNIGGETANTQIANILLKLEELFNKIGKPDLLIVPGDVNSTLAGAIAANKMGVKLAHLESGLRSFDKKMPEEINRIAVDNISDICFVTEPSGKLNLEKEKISARIEYVGNTMIDTLVYFEKEIDKSSVLEELNINNQKFILMTFHRPSNVDSKNSLDNLLNLFRILAQQSLLVFPLHPRTKKNMEHYGLLTSLKEIDNLIITQPLGYFEFQKLIKHSTVVITDSGGIQEETTYRQVPCLTIRNNTERPVTLVEGTNTLVGFDIEEIVTMISLVLKGDYKKGNVPKLWDGNATERILNSL